MSKHTSGPWKTFQRVSQDCLAEIVVAADNGCPIAVVSNHAEFKNNAKLIAAAPDLLKVLKRIADAVDFNGTGHPLFDGMQKQMTDAIAKAEGRS